VTEPASNPNAPAGDPLEPTQHNNASTLDTTDGDTIPPGATTHIVGGPGQAHAVFQISDLQAFLYERFPDEMDLTNRQQPERTVDTAMRLLLSLSATAPASQVTRCPQEYCNQPQGHTTQHGVVHTG
jgi:hypothetical protein